MPIIWLAFVTGLKVDALCADLATFVPGRTLDDNAHVMLRYQEARADSSGRHMWRSGCSNGLRLRVFGETGSLAWYQEEPNVLLHAPLNGTAGHGQARPRRPGPGRGHAHPNAPGHPEGYIEAFAKSYRGFCRGHSGTARQPRPVRHRPERCRRGAMAEGRRLVDAVVKLPRGRRAALIKPPYILSRHNELAAAHFAAGRAKRTSKPLGLKKRQQRRNKVKQISNSGLWPVPWPFRQLPSDGTPSYADGQMKVAMITHGQPATASGTLSARVRRPPPRRTTFQLIYYADPTATKEAQTDLERGPAACRRDRSDAGIP